MYCTPLKPNELVYYLRILLLITLTLPSCTKAPITAMEEGADSALTGALHRAAANGDAAAIAALIAGAQR